MIGEIKEYLKKISSLKAINRSYLIPFKILDSFPEKVILKFMWKDEGSRIAKALLYKNKIEELIIYQASKHDIKAMKRLTNKIGYNRKSRNKPTKS